MKITNVFQVATHRLCIGCGACFYICPNDKVKLVDIEEDGIRPIVLQGGCDACDLCLKVCPGLNTALPDQSSNHRPLNQVEKRWGSVLELWEGYAADSAIRFKGSSGGLCTALSLFCIEKGIAGGVLHIGSDPKRPWLNKTFRSTTRAEVLARTGSRYSPASPSDGLKLIEEAADSSVFVGKPCDVTGLRMTQAMKAEVDKKTSLAIGFFCAGTPSTRGTLDFLREHHIDLDEISEFRYRGMGWPGQAAVWRKNDNNPFVQVSYKDSWGFVQKYRPFRCYLCPDLTAEFADISVGDPWYREVGENEPGQSLILIRTEKGRKIFQEAIESGYVKAIRAEPDILYASQKNLLGKRQVIWGRLLAMKWQ
jgi:coenzyme F420 hydrogenase subunit beta